MLILFTQSASVECDGVFVEDKFFKPIYEDEWKLEIGQK